MQRVICGPRSSPPSHPPHPFGGVVHIQLREEVGPRPRGPVWHVGWWGGEGAGGRENGKLGTASEGFPQYDKLGSVRHECELQGVMTS